MFVSLPTGFGKKICFQILPFVFDHKGGGNHAVVIVSPLIALMINQVKSLRCKGVTASILLEPETLYQKSFELLRELFKLPAWCFALWNP